MRSWSAPESDPILGADAWVCQVYNSDYLRAWRAQAHGKRLLWLGRQAVNLEELRQHISERKAYGASWVCLSIEDIEELIRLADRPNSYSSMIGEQSFVMVADGSTL